MAFIVIAWWYGGINRWWGGWLLHDATVNRLRWGRVREDEDSGVLFDLLLQGVELPADHGRPLLPLDGDGEDLLLWLERGVGYQVRSQGRCRETWIQYLLRNNLDSDQRKYLEVALHVRQESCPETKISEKNRGPRDWKA